MESKYKTSSNQRIYRFLSKMKYVKIVSIAIFIIGCTNKKSNSSNVAVVFNPVFEKEIVNFISYMDKEYGEDTQRFYEIFSYKKDNDCYLWVSTSYCYNKDMLIGYTFLSNQLVAYYDNNSNEDNCYTNFINQEYLTPFKQFIKGYKSSKECDMDYDPIRRDFKIVGNSLEIS